MTRRFVDPRNTRHRPDSTYPNVIKKIQQDGVCPFCPEYLKKYHLRPIIRDGVHWTLTDNMYPYKGAKHHLLFIHKKHIERLSDISPAGWTELHDLAMFATKKRRIKGGALAMRFGDTVYTGASVAHLHAQIISKDMTEKNPNPVLFRVG
ncbi:MAG: HIT domain-containing protein [Patescibacteria group bacterium]